MDFLQVVAVIFSLLIAVAVHECSHAFVADRLGDPTARLAGRVTLNPLAHIDIFGAIFLFLVGFGWGKPVPVNTRFFRRPVLHESLVSLAGPLSNFLFCLLVAGILHLFRDVLPYQVFRFLMTVFDMNLGLCIFNLFPFPPLDGSKFFRILVPSKILPAYDRYLETGMMYTILFLIFDAMILSNILGYSVVSRVISVIFGVIKGTIFLGF